MCVCIQAYGSDAMSEEMGDPDKAELHMSIATELDSFNTIYGWVGICHMMLSRHTYSSYVYTHMMTRV